MTHPILVTGLSGAGKASALRALEDLGYEAVDNPPLALLDQLIARSEAPLAICLDVRSRGFDASKVLTMLDRLRTENGAAIRIVFMSADTTVLLQRYTESRRRHPLSPNGRVIDGIEREATLLRPLRDAADVVIDTSIIKQQELRQRMAVLFGPGSGAGAQALTVTLVSFAFPASLPREADMVFDARFLRNPHYVPALRDQTGVDAAVADYIEADPDFAGFFAGITGLLALILPRFVQEGKRYATIAVGCTGGRHRSVWVVEKLAGALIAPNRSDMNWSLHVLHRELDLRRTVAIANPPVLTELPVE